MSARGSSGRAKRADAPVAKVDFVNLVAGTPGTETTSPQPTNHALVAQGAIGFDGAVLLNTRALVDEALKQPDLFSSEDLVEQGNTLPLIPLNIDPPDHVKYRRLLDPLFAPRRIDALETDIAARCTTSSTSSPNTGRATSLPSSPSCSRVGLPGDDGPALGGARHPDRVPRRTPAPGHPGRCSRGTLGDPAHDRATGLRVLRRHPRRARRRAARRHPLAVRDHRSEGDRLTRDEVLAICFVLLTAGLDTVTDSLTCFFAFLAQHPDHRRRIVEEPAIIPDAVEELLRWETPVPAVVRWAREEASLGGETVAAGHHVWSTSTAANLDPAEFTDPLDVQFDRPVNRHLAFGGGVHRASARTWRAESYVSRSVSGTDGSRTTD